MVPTKPSAGMDAGHPLDPLSAAEVALASEILSREKRLGPHARFTHVQLEEPAKPDVLGWKPATAHLRRAAVPPFGSMTRPPHFRNAGPESEALPAVLHESTQGHS